MTDAVRLTELPITSPGQLLEVFARGNRPRAEWGVGAESEKLVIDAETGDAADFSRIEKLLQRLATEGEWREIREQGHLVGLIGPHSSVTLEPGGQLELSGRFCPDLHCSDGDLRGHINTILSHAEPLGLAFLGLGAQPFTPLKQIDWLPKNRYDIMGPYMMRSGDMGQRMMKQTAGLQVNLDYSNESDCLRKMRLCQSLTPLLYGLFANSPLLDGRPSGYLSCRGEIWSRTDPDRCGLLPFLFNPAARLTDYVDYALDVPMYFIERQGRLINLTGSRFSFRRFMAEGKEDFHATLADWELHLSTLFPEIRLRPQIEIRTADSLPPQMSLAVAALLKGLLYDADAEREALELFADMSPEEHQLSYHNSWRLGLKAPAGSRSLGELAALILPLAREGLKNQAHLDQRGCDETCYLNGVAELIDSGQTLAERLLARWTGNRRQDLVLLLQHCQF